MNIIFYNLHVPDSKNESYGFEVLTLKLLKYFLNKIYPKEITKLNLVHSLEKLFRAPAKIVSTYLNVIHKFNLTLYTAMLSTNVLNWAYQLLLVISSGSLLFCNYL